MVELLVGELREEDATSQKPPEIRRVLTEAEVHMHARAQQHSKILSIGLFLSSADSGIVDSLQNGRVEYTVAPCCREQFLTLFCFCLTLYPGRLSACAVSDFSPICPATSSPEQPVFLGSSFLPPGVSSAVAVGVWLSVLRTSPLSPSSSSSSSPSSSSCILILLGLTSTRS